MITAAIILLAFVPAVYLFMQLPRFGRRPRGERLARIQRSPHYRNGKFQNLSPTPDLTEGSSIFSILWKFLFAKNARRKPDVDLPHIKTNLREISPDADVLVWLGHSSYFIQIDGKKILVDPVLNGVAAPLPFTMRSFRGSDMCTADDIPGIDYLFITHDHWDHLDYKAMLQLKSKTGRIITGLGTGEHFERWGFDMNRVLEMDWQEEAALKDGFRVFATPARHFSGRGFARNKALWISFVLQTPTQKIFIGGDSGYDTHFEVIGKKFGGFDWAILENGQYDANWKYIHMMPEDFLTAAKALRARNIIPVHSCKFAMANHSWDEPLQKVTEFNKTENLHLVTPVIGEVVYLKDASQKFQNWWNGYPGFAR